MPIYMKYEGIEGPSTGKYKGWIELDSVETLMRSRKVLPGGETSRKDGSSPSVSEIVIKKVHDSSSSQLYHQLLSSSPKKVTIDFLKDDGTIYLQVDLESVLISSFSVSGKEADSVPKPLEKITLTFSKIAYKALGSANNQKAGKDTVNWQLAQ